MELLRWQAASRRRPGHQLGQLNLALRLHPSRCTEPGCCHAYFMGLQLCTDTGCMPSLRLALPARLIHGNVIMRPDAPARPACMKHITQPRVLLAPCRQDGPLPAAGGTAQMAGLSSAAQRAEGGAPPADPGAAALKGTPAGGPWSGRWIWKRTGLGSWGMACVQAWPAVRLGELGA